MALEPRTERLSGTVYLTTGSDTVDFRERLKAATGAPVTAPEYSPWKDCASRSVRLSVFFAHVLTKVRRRDARMNPGGNTKFKLSS